MGFCWSLIAKSTLLIFPHKLKMGTKEKKLKLKLDLLYFFLPFSMGSLEIFSLHFRINLEQPKVDKSLPTKMEQMRREEKDERLFQAPTQVIRLLDKLVHDFF